MFSRFSTKAKNLADSSKDGSIKLEEIDGETFEVIVVFLDLHKEKEPVKITVPIRSNQSLKHIMEDGDAELV